MYSLCKIDAVHSVLKRVIKSHMTPEEMSDLLVELIDAGYEMNDIKCSQRTIYEKGDMITVHRADLKRLERKSVNNIERKKISEVIKTFEYMFGKKLPLQMVGIVNHIRTNRQRGTVVINWQGNDVDPIFKQINTAILEEIGFEFEQPDFKELPISKCDDNMLNDEERVIKYMMLMNDINEETVRIWLKPVFLAMNKAECIIYRP